MSVLRDWRCAAHGNFESKEDAPLCPHGCDVVSKVFLVPPGFRSARTASIDRTVQSLATSHGMTDINNRGGQAAKRQSGASAQQQEELRRVIHERYGDGWGKVPAGGTMNVKTQQIEGEVAGGGAGGALAAYRGRPDNVLGEVRDGLVPKPVLIRQDHENLKVSDARPPA